MDAAEEARWHGILRFAVGVTVAYVVCEWLAWTPTFLAPVFVAALLANLPMRPPLKMSIALALIMAASAWSAFALASLLRGSPIVLLGAIALVMFLAFHTMAQGRAKFPALLLLISLGSVPVLVMISPGQASILPMAMTRGMALALIIIGIVHLVWPRIAPPVAPAQGTADDSAPVAKALVSTAIVLPLMLVYLLFGLANALPVMIATVMLVANFDVQRSQAHALGMILGNAAGGVLSLLVYWLLTTTPVLPFLGLLLFVVLLGFGQRIVAGGAVAPVAVIACNAMLIILGTTIASGPGSLTIWLTRLSQFVIAGAFAVGMMSLLWHRAAPSAPSAAAKPPSR